MILLGAGIMLIVFASIGFWFLKDDLRFGSSSEHAWVGLVSWWWWTESQEEYDRKMRPVAYWTTLLFNLAFYLALLAAGSFLIFLSTVKP